MRRSGSAKAKSKAKAKNKAPVKTKAKVKIKAKVKARTKAKAEAKLRPKPKPKPKAMPKPKARAKGTTKARATPKAKAKARAPARARNTGGKTRTMGAKEIGKARDIARRFLESDAELAPFAAEMAAAKEKDVEESQYGLVAHFELDNAYIEVAPRMGAVTLYRRKDVGSLPPLPSALTAAEIVSRCDGFARRHVRDFDRRKFIPQPEIAIEDTGHVGCSWDEDPMDGEVSIAANFVSVFLDPRSGIVSEFACMDFPFRRTKPVKIDEAQAVQRAQAAVPRKADPRRIALIEEPVDGGRKARTVWEVDLAEPAGDESMGEEWMVEIDADTGEMVRADPVE